MNAKKFRKVSVVALSLATVMMAATPVDARRGGSFGSRGSRTADAPPPTRTAPQQQAPVERTMTDKSAQTGATPAGAQRPAGQQGAAPNAAQRPAQTPAKPGMGGMAKGLMGGLLMGGLIGMMMGGGLGALGGSGLLMALLQVALIGGLVWLALRLFRRRSAAPAMAGAGAPVAGGFGQSPFAAAQQPAQNAPRPMPVPMAAAPVAPVSQDLEITADDQYVFEQLLIGVQDAFGREDYATLRTYTTPEVMSYLAEEMSTNATRGLRNSVSGTELLQADISEAWSEAGGDYATVAMRYQSIDVMLDRNTGAVVEGDPVNPTQTTELWTFVRDANKLWLLSAIQQA